MSELLNSILLTICGSSISFAVISISKLVLFNASLSAALGFNVSFTVYFPAFACEKSNVDTSTAVVSSVPA